MSRDLIDLMPDVRAKVVATVNGCKARGVDVLVYCTHRSAAEQAVLYAQGRVSKGPIVTNAKPWESWHQYRRAIDAVPMRAGKPLWTYNAKDPEWRALVEEAEKAGLEWAGRWRLFKESVHFQSLDGLTKEQAKAAMVAVGFVPV